MNEINHCQKPDYRPPHLTPRPVALSRGTYTVPPYGGDLPYGRTGRATGPGSLIPPGAFSSARRSGRSARAHTHLADTLLIVRRRSPCPRGHANPHALRGPPGHCTEAAGGKISGLMTYLEKIAITTRAVVSTLFLDRFLGGRKRCIQVGTRVRGFGPLTLVR